MELRATFGNVYRKEKHCSVRPCMPRRMLVAMQMEEFMTRRYELRFNRMKGCKEYRERHSLFTDYRPVTAEAVKASVSRRSWKGYRQSNMTCSVTWTPGVFPITGRSRSSFSICRIGTGRTASVPLPIVCHAKTRSGGISFIFGSSVWWHTGCKWTGNMPIARHPCWSGRRGAARVLLPESSAARTATLLCRWDRLGKPEGCGDGVEPFRADQPG